MSDDETLLGSMILMKSSQWQMGETGSIGIVVSEQVEPGGTRIVNVRFADRYMLVSRHWLLQSGNCDLFLR